jgi:2-polyprenyl-3-methyl-5-hydroxy-6-metoxy-1,4-benzoquinol methylase
MFKVNICPVCSNTTFLKLLDCEDYTVSHETFAITDCTECGFRVTNPRPEDSVISNYYKSNQYISHSGVADNIVDRIYLLARKFTLKQKLSLISKYKTPPGKILDYGCGTGEFLNTCKTASWKINGVEPSATAREKSATLNNVKIFQSVDEIHDKYDIITLWHVLEHIPNLEYTLQKLSDAINDNGTLFIAVPNHKSYDAQYYQNFWAAYDVPRHLWHFDKSAMIKLLAKFSLHVKKIQPMKLDAFYVSMLSETYKQNGKKSFFTLLRAVINGIKSNTSARKTGNYSSLIYIVQK